MPGEKEFSAASCLNMLPYISLQNFITHPLPAGFSSRMTVTGIVAVTAPEVTPGANRLDKNLELAAFRTHDRNLP
jgi:hypothetical protein